MDFRHLTTGLFSDRYRLVKYLGALAAFLTALLTYLATMAPTVSFWDCGEFIACSHTLGVPHPPGAPLFAVLGRFSTFFHLFADKSAQINFLSALGSALSVLFMYLVIARSLGYWADKLDRFTGTAVVVGGAYGGALALTLSNTFWFSAVEAEVYGVAMLLMMVIIWVFMLWMDRRQQPGSEKLLVLIIYLLFLSEGFHITVMMIIPALALMMVYLDRELLADWRLYAIGVILSTVMYAFDDYIFISYFAAVVLYVNIVFVRRNWPAWFALLMGAVLVFAAVNVFTFVPVTTFVKGLSFWTYLAVAAFAVALFVLKGKTRYNNNFWFWVVFVSIVATSVHIYTPIRSSLNPNIDENDPQQWESFLGYIERKQYGSESMVTSMFHRRTTWKEQFGVNPHCGLWGFLREQYTLPVHNLHFIPLLIGLFGLWVQWRGERRSAGLFGILLFLGTLGMLLYLNFKIDEVRKRDYFYTQGFIFCAYWIGIGLAGLIYAAARAVREGFLRRLAVGAAALACMVLPAVPVLATAHYNDDRDIWFTHSRSGDYIPWDYAYNILQTCAPNGVIFTNGDNDTFPLWCLQEVDQVRTDVRIVNLSLLNTPWYIKQLRDVEPKIAIRFDDNFIDTKVVPQRVPKDGMIYAGGLPVKLTRGQIFRVQDWMIVEIINAVQWQKPVYFAVTVSEGNKLGLDEYMTMEGMAFRMYPQKVASNLDVEKTRHNLWDVYKYRGLTDPLVYKDDNSLKLLSNYNAAYFQLALRYANEMNRPEEAISTLNRADSLIGIGWRGYYLKSQIYTRMGKYQEAADQLNLVLKEKPQEIGVFMNLGQIYSSIGKPEEAIQAYEKVLAIRPNVGQAYQALEKLYLDKKDFGKIVQIINRWLTINPKDEQARQRLAMYQQQLGQPPAAGHAPQATLTPLPATQAPGQ
jgi:tetratricopeptide (TPR) repeat protein